MRPLSQARMTSLTLQFPTYTLTAMTVLNPCDGVHQRYGLADQQQRSTAAVGALGLRRQGQHPRSRPVTSMTHAHFVFFFFGGGVSSRTQWGGASPAPCIRGTEHTIRVPLSLSLVRMTHQYDSSRIGGGGRSTPSVSTRGRQQATSATFC